MWVRRRMAIRLPTHQSNVSTKSIIMTTKEQQTIDQLHKLVQEMRAENAEFKGSVSLLVSGIVEKVDQKHIPLYMEKEIVSTVQDSIKSALQAALTGYQSPLTKYAANVVGRYQTQIEAIFDDAVKQGIATDEFKLRVREVLLHKIAKTMISGVDGSIDKTINLMKQDQVFRSRLTLSVNQLVEEFLEKQKQ